MKSMMRYVIASILLAVTSYAIAIDDKVIKFEKKRLEANKQLEIKEVQLSFKKELSQKEWYGFLFDIDASFKGKAVTFKDIVFSNGEYIALDLIDINTQQSLKKSVVPNLEAKYHSEKNFLMGNPNAEDKIVVFSDPLCPFCMDYIPDVIRHVQKNSDKIALYYYHFPLLQMHPASGPLSKIMDVAMQQGKKDIVLKVYETDWDKYFTEKQKSEKIILAAFNKEFGTNITLAQIQDKEVEDKILHDIYMGEDVLVQGTPTIFVNGAKDNNKTNFLKLGK